MTARPIPRWESPDPDPLYVPEQYAAPVEPLTERQLAAVIRHAIAASDAQGDGGVRYRVIGGRLVRWPSRWLWLVLLLVALYVWRKRL